MNTRRDKYIRELKAIFRDARDKHEANRKSAEVLTNMSADKEFFTDVLDRHLKNPNNLNTLHYPVVGLDIELNEDFGLVANCWIPLPDKAVDISTKAIHHHGDMLLSTVTAFGTGYEHWMFETPTLVDANTELYELKVLERTPHPRHHVAFVDAYVAHLPLYPPDLTITYALWSSRFPTTWKDKVKRMPIVRENSARLKSLATKLGAAKKLDIKIVEYFDFYPTGDGFRGIKVREEFSRSTNDDYLASLFHVIQETDNVHLVSTLRKTVEAGTITDRDRVDEYIRAIEKGDPIAGRLSPEHYNVPRANFSKNEILAALGAQERRGKTH
jgi:hypothetical protein